MCECIPPPPPIIINERNATQTSPQSPPAENPDKWPCMSQTSYGVKEMVLHFVTWFCQHTMKCIGELISSWFHQGKAGIQFVLRELENLYSICWLHVLECVPMKACTVIKCLLLQKPHAKSKAKEHSTRLEEDWSCGQRWHQCPSPWGWMHSEALVLFKADSWPGEDIYNVQSLDVPWKATCSSLRAFTKMRLGESCLRMTQYLLIMDRIKITNNRQYVMFSLNSTPKEGSLWRMPC